jgi:thiamine pyrophosphokinase
MHVVVFAAGTLRPGRAVDEAIASADLIIAADEGAATARRYDRIPAIIVGDFDSLPELELAAIQEAGAEGDRIEIIRVPAEKEETDTELALQVALERGASRITLLGALGGARFDHTMANVLLLADFAAIPIRIVDGPSICWLLRGPGSTSIHGQRGDLLSLLPLTGDATGVRTANLYYPLHGETLRFGRTRGISNVLTGAQAEVSLEHGLLFVIHTATQDL